MTTFDSLGFQWNRGSVPRQFPRASLERVVFRFRRMLPEYVWDAGVLEGNPFTFPEVKTLLEGVTVGGRKVSDQEQILNLAESSKQLVELVKQRQFELDKATFCSLHALVARNEALEWGHFRGEGTETQFTPYVALGDRGKFEPLVTEKGAVRLNEVFENGRRSLTEHVRDPFERATAFFLFGSLQQFFFDGNKRTSRFMMNGILMSEGIDAVSIPAARAAEFNSKMVNFYETRDGTEMMAFVLDCHPSASEVYQLNPALSRIEDAPRIKYFRLEDPIGPTHEIEQSSGNNKTNQSQRGITEPQQPAIDRQDSTEPPTRRLSSEELRRKARENWLKNYYYKRHDPSQAGSQTDSRQKGTRKEAEKPQPEKDTGLDPDPE
jgi:prophage maintenance system killer protein